MNSVELTGRLTRDPAVSATTGQNPLSVARFTIAVERNQKREEGRQNADFIGIKVLGKLADWAGRYLHKGIKVEVAGRLTSDDYVNREGQRVHDVYVLAREIQFAESKAASAGHTAPVPQMPVTQVNPAAPQAVPQAAQQQAAPQVAPAQEPSGFADAGSDDFMDVSPASGFDSDLPFE